MITSPEEFRQRLLDIQNSVNVVYTTLPSDEPRFIIDANSRTITIPVEFQFLGVKNDHNAETVYFEIDRYFDDEDLSQHTCVVQFANKNNSNDGGIYPVTTMDTTSVDGKIIFGWEIKSDATSLVGDIYFSVRFYSINSTDYVFTYNFNTLTAKSVILDTLDVDNQMIIENYPSELDAWLDRMNELEAGTSGKVEEIEAKGQEVLTEINSVKVSIPEDYSTLSSDVSELKSDLGYKLHEAVWDINTHSFDEFTTAVSSGFWGNDKLFIKGYIKSISVKTIGEFSNEPLEIVFLNSDKKCILKRVIYDFISGINEIKIGSYVHEDFYVLIKCNGKLSYQSIEDGSKWTLYTNSIDLENVINIEFNDGNYKFGFVVNYDSVTNIFSRGSLLLPTTKKLYNKVFASGDSITATYPTFNDEIGWVNQVGKSLGLEMEHGAASGNGYVYSTGSGNAKSITNDTDFGLYNFALYAWGTNDYGNNCEIGTLEDETPGREHLHLYGVLHWIIRKVLSDNMECTPILITPINRTDYGTEASNWAYGTPNELGYTLSDYCDAIVNIAKYYGIPYVDNRISPFTRVTTQYLLGDNLHPTEIGYRMYGKWLSAQLSQYIRPYVI